MAVSFGGKFTIVEVTADDLAPGRRRQLWVAAAKSNQAVTLVLTAIPEGWTAELSSGRLTRQHVAALEMLKLAPGDVREMPKLGSLDWRPV